MYALQAAVVTGLSAAIQDKNTEISSAASAADNGRQQSVRFQIAAA